MNKNLKKFFKKHILIKVLLISPFLLSIPLLNNTEAKAALEFQWDEDSGYRKLKWFQKNNLSKARNTIFFFFRPNDRKESLLKITLKIPKTFKSEIKKEKISFCKVRIGGYETRTKCIEDIPADIELNEDKTSLDIFPYTPIPRNKDSYAIVIKVFNPRRTGLYQFHSFGQYFGNDSVSSYLGSATILID